MLNFIKWPLAAAVLAGSLAAAPPMMAGDGDHDGKKIGHVFVIILENEGFNTTFGTTAQQNPATQYLSQTLPSQGVLLSQYYGTGHVSLDNYIAMISGQSSTVQTHVDCTFYDDFKLTGVTPDGQAIGTGCVYPAQFKTLADQLTAAGKTWKGYMEDMGKNPKREQTTCGQPLDPQGKVALNEVDALRHHLAPSVAKVIENCGLMPLSHEKSSHSSANVSCTASNQNSHKNTVLPERFALT